MLGVCHFYVLYESISHLILLRNKCFTKSSILKNEDNYMARSNNFLNGFFHFPRTTVGILKFNEPLIHIDFNVIFP